MNQTLNTILKQRINILCLGNFEMSHLEPLFPELKQLRKLESESDFKLGKRMLLVIPTSGIQKSLLQMDTQSVCDTDIDVFFVKSDLLNSVSLLFSKEPFKSIAPGSVYRNMANRLNELSISRVLLFSSDNTFENDDINSFILNEQKIFNCNSINTFVVCVYGKNNNSVTDQGGSLSDTAKMAVKHYEQNDISAFSVCTYRNSHIVEDWNNVFSASKINKVTNKLNRFEEALSRIRYNMDEFYSIIVEGLKQQYVNDGSKENVIRGLVYNPLLKLNEIEIVFPENYQTKWMGFFGNSSQRMIAVSKFFKEVKDDILKHIKTK